MAIVRAMAGGREVVAASDNAPDDTSPGKSAEPTVAARPTWHYIVFAVVVAIVGYVVGLALQHHFHRNFSQLPTLADGFSLFGLLYIFAQAIERLLVPVSWFGGGFLDGGTTKKQVAQAEQAAVLALNMSAPDQAEQSAKTAANAKHKVEQYAANLTATNFGVASAAASLLAGYSGAFLLAIVGVRTSPWLDLLVTSLAIAGGTKPLSDLVSAISKKTESAAAG